MALWTQHFQDRVFRNNPAMQLKIRHSLTISRSSLRQVQLTYSCTLPEGYCHVARPSL
jgi:hypothetical protein